MIYDVMCYVFIFLMKKNDKLFKNKVFWEELECIKLINESLISIFFFQFVTKFLPLFC